MEARYPFQLCEHAIHGWAAVYPTPTHLAESQNWTLISEPLIREELVWVLKKTKNKSKSYFNVFLEIYLPGLVQGLCLLHYRGLCVLSLTIPISGPALAISSPSNPQGQTLLSTNLQQLSGSVCQTELPQHPQLQLIADGGSFATVEGISSLDLLCVSQLLQPPDHLLYHRQLRH